MDIVIVAALAGLAFWAGSVFGIRQGVELGRAEAQVRRRLDELGGE